jgi:hypothetical protein
MKKLIEDFTQHISEALSIGKNTKLNPSSKKG